MRFPAIAAVLLIASPVQAQTVLDPAPQEELDPENAPQTVDAIVSKKPVNARRAWRPAGTGKLLNIDYDQDGATDTARLVNNGRHTAVLVTSGRTGEIVTAWLIDDKDGLAPDVYLEAVGKGSISVVFPESTAVILSMEGGKRLATYMNG